MSGQSGSLRGIGGAPGRTSGARDQRQSPSSMASTLRRGARLLIRGREGVATWEHPAFVGLLVATAALYLINLSANGWANSFYSAAVQAGSTNWEAFLFGSSDAANSITVDKPPASLWLMALSVRLFGLSSFSILLPQALMGVATVGLVYGVVRRRFSAVAALTAGAVLALTPVAVLMFRFNNPDALLVLLLTAAGALTLRGIETGKIRWVIWAGVAIGFGFLTKQLQAFVVLPVLAGVYLVAAPVILRKRLLHLLAALAAVIVSAGWWVAIVELVPASMRPYVGGSQNNSFLELTFGYNGFGRLTGEETGSVTGGRGGAATGGMWGSTGLTRLFGEQFGGQVMWLVPAALIVGVAALVLIGRRHRTDARRATLLLFGGWLVLTGLVFSFMSGIFHPYYTVALAPAIAVVIGAGADVLWRRRDRLWVRIVLAVAVLVTGGWGFALLSRAESWQPWIRIAVLVLSVIGAVLVLVPRRGRRLASATVAVLLAASLLGPTAFSIDTIATAHSGSLPSAGPAVQGGGFGGRGGGAAGGRGFGFGAGRGGNPPAFGTGQGTGAGTAQGAAPGAGAPVGGTQTGRGGAGGLLEAATVSKQLASYLAQNASDYTWIAAAVGSNSASGYQLATGDPVMPIGGFNGSDPSPTLAQFKQLVADGKIHYFIGGTVGASHGGSSASSEIAAWVEASFTKTTVDGVTLYDLTS